MRRRPQTAEHLVDHAIPHMPVRQWVLSLPTPLRLLLAAQPELQDMDQTYLADLDADGDEARRLRPLSPCRPRLASGRTNEVRCERRRTH